MDKKLQFENKVIYVSIIVPVYQVEHRIERCIKSLRRQTMPSFEVILVDDGSRDASGLICDKMAVVDNRFTVIHKQNGGVASAKQAGLEVARGEYVIYVDSDDWVEDTMLEDLLNHAKQHNADMVICDYIECREDGEYYIEQNPRSSDASKVLTYLLSGDIHGSNCNKLIKRDVIVNYRISFPHLPIMNEDTYFNTALLMHTIKLSYLNKAFYHYDRTNENSVTRAGNPKSGLYAFQSCEAFRTLMKDHQTYWNLFVKEEMPWMAYLCLYYGSVSRRDYYRAFRELSELTLNGEGKIAKMALNNYKIMRFYLWLRKNFSRLRSFHK